MGEFPTHMTEISTESLKLAWFTLASALEFMALDLMVLFTQLRHSRLTPWHPRHPTVRTSTTTQSTMVPIETATEWLIVWISLPCPLRSLEVLSFLSTTKQRSSEPTSLSI